MTISKAYNLLERDGVSSGGRAGRWWSQRWIPPRSSLQKIEHLRTSLADAVRVARQLGIDADEAMRVFP